MNNDQNKNKTESFQYKISSSEEIFFDREYFDQYMERFSTELENALNNTLRVIHDMDDSEQKNRMTEALDSVEQAANILIINLQKMGVIKVNRKRGGYQIPEDLARALINKIEELGGAIKVPIDAACKWFGMSTWGSDKGKPHRIKKKLNTQHGKLLPDDEIFHVGLHQVERMFIFYIKWVGKKEASSWKSGM